ncbi:hypothetical protein EST38_g11996 [Candolleomyces aberdarensis]|uniref:PH domain-containing protein n=1 Tax=Candolleomyces aberdarensis TaxID=2316362 RepID=A0A4Q2D466_9AGAR|nr:hypothetical protein EST38_g11996 [Candolleomyces aberdarensis]
MLMQLPGAGNNREPIPIVCRFIPYDQWFLTHLAPYWKGKHIKHHILARCLNLTYKPPDPPPSYAAKEEDQDRRPPSPITFAPDPRNRPASPILFATVPPRNALFSSEEDDDSMTMEGDWDDDDAEGMSDTQRRRDKGKARQVDSPDEGDDFSDDNAAPIGGRVMPSKSTLISSSATLAPKSSPSAPPVETSEDRKVVPSVAHLSFTLIRFSTGQLVEDEYPLTEYDLKCHEILELHYSFASPRKTPRSGHILPPTSNFPFPLLDPPPQLTRQKSKRKNTRLKELIAAHSLRLVQLPRSIPNSYVQPYWEGWVRILRYICREDLDYLYGRAYMVPGAAASGSSTKQKQKLGPGFAQYGAGPLFHPMTVQGTEAVGEDIRENDLDASLALNFGLAPAKAAKPKDGLFAQDLLLNPTRNHHDEHRSRFEWRERWLVVRDGWIFLLRDRADTKPTHRFSLAQLHMLRDADKLIDSIDNAKAYRRPPDLSRPAREKDRAGPATPRDKQSTPTVSDARSTRSPSPNSTLKGAPLPSPLQSGYGHGRHRFGKHSSKPSVVTQEEDAYEEDDEGEGSRYAESSHRKPSGSSQASRRHHTHQAHQHQHHQSHSRRPEPARPRPRDFTDPAVRARINPSTFIPNSKDEADLFGMKIICAKFLHPATSEKGPDPFGDLTVDNEVRSAGKQYTSTGPSLADVTVPIPSALVLAGLPAPDRELEREQEMMSKSKGKERDHHHHHHRTKPDSSGEHRKMRLHSKGSAPTSLAQAIPKALSMTADRRPSLPTLAHITTGSDSHRHHHQHHNGHLLNAQQGSMSSNVIGGNGSSASLSFASFFGTSVKDKEEKRREKEAKELKKAEKKRVERERKEREREREMDYEGGATSGSSWKLPNLGKRSKRSMRTPQSTVGTVDEEWAEPSARTEEGTVNQVSEGLDRVVNERNCFSDPEGGNRGGGNVMSDQSSLSSAQDEPMSPVASKAPGHASAYEDQDQDDSDLEDLPPPPPPKSNASDHSPSSLAPPAGKPESATAESNSPAKGSTLVHESDTDSASISISSPVFARESPGFGEDGDSDLEIDLGLRRRRTGYRYGGFHKPELDTVPSASTPPEIAEAPVAAAASASASGSASGSSRPADYHRPLERTASSGRPADVASDRGTIRQDSYSGRSVPKIERVKSDRKKNLRRGEWVIMDFGNDAAYHSLLRILHRHMEGPISTSFVPALQRLAAPPRPLIQAQETPPPSPPARHPHPMFDKPLPPSPAQPSPGDRSNESHSNSPLSSPLRARSRSDAGFMAPSRLYKAGPYSDDENDGRLSRASPTPYHHPRPLYPSKLSTTIAAAAAVQDDGFGANAIPRSLGPFPYPEWRLRAVQRAQRSSLGQVHRPLELMLLAMNERHADCFDLGDPVFPGPPQLEFGVGGGGGGSSEQVHGSRVPGQDEEEEEEGEEGRGEGQGGQAAEESPLKGKSDEEDEGEDMLLFTDESEEESQSELEWQTWKADLGRQIRLRREGRSMGTVSPYDPRPSASDFRVGDELEETDGGTPSTLEGETLAILRKRREREPCGVISSLYTSTALPGFVAKDVEHHDNEEHRMYHRSQRYPGGPASFSVATLSSPSSSESLAQHRIPSGTHTPDVAVQVVVALGTWEDKFPFAPFVFDASKPTHSDGNAARRTGIFDEKTYLNPSSFGMAIQELKGNDNVSTHSYMPTSSSYESSSYRYNLADNESNNNVSGSSYSYDPFVPGSPVSQHRAPSNLSLASASPLASSSNLRHQNSSFSMGRSSSASVKMGNVLKKKPSSDRNLDMRSRKTSYSTVDTSGGYSPRPKLTVATSPTSTIAPGREQLSPPPLQSPTLPPAGGSSGSAGRSASRSVLRHVKSGSSLKSVEDSPAGGPVHTSPGGGEAKAKRKRSGAFGKFFS